MIMIKKNITGTTRKMETVNYGICWRLILPSGITLKYHVKKSRLL